MLLTTQYLEEADRLARRIAVVDHGRVAAQGTPSQLKAAVGGNVLRVRLADPADLGQAQSELAPLAAGDEPYVDGAAAEIRLGVADPGASAEALRRLDAHRVSVATIEVVEPSLDDVFLALTGRIPVPEASTETSAAASSDRDLQEAAR